VVAPREKKVPHVDLDPYLNSNDLSSSGGGGELLRRRSGGGQIPATASLLPLPSFLSDWSWEGRGGGDAGGAWSGGGGGARGVWSCGEMQCRGCDDCWSRCNRNEVQNTVHTRQSSICLPNCKSLFDSVSPR
jgi:hypothetical protein